MDATAEAAGLVAGVLLIGALLAPPESRGPIIGIALVPAVVAVEAALRSKRVRSAVRRGAIIQGMSYADVIKAWGPPGKVGYLLNEGIPLWFTSPLTPRLRFGPDLVDPETRPVILGYETVECFVVLRHGGVSEVWLRPPESIPIRWKWRVRSGPLAKEGMG